MDGVILYGDGLEGVGGNPSSVKESVGGHSKENRNKEDEL